MSSRIRRGKNLPDLCFGGTFQEYVSGARCFAAYSVFLSETTS
jgi:hypothetical protein